MRLEVALQGVLETHMKAEMKAAGREGACVVLILGPDERERGRLVARDMTSGEEREVVLSDLM